MTEIEQLKKRVEQLEEQLATQPTEKPMERWKPGIGQDYAYIHSDGEICNHTNDNGGLDQVRIKFGNAFPKEMEDYLESDHAKLLQFHNEMASILWQIDRKNMGGEGFYGMDACRPEKNLKQRIAFQYSFPSSETADLAWSMLSDEIKEWLTT